MFKSRIFKRLGARVTGNSYNAVGITWHQPQRLTIVGGSKECNGPFRKPQRPRLVPRHDTGGGVEGHNAVGIAWHQPH